MNRWTIRARVTNQPTLRTYHNAKGYGKVLNVDLLDAEGGEIKAVCFGDTAEMYAEKFRAGAVYDVSKAQLQSVRNKQYSNHEFEIRLDHGSVVEECTDQAAIGQIKRINYAFRKISDLENAPSGAMVDVVAVVHAVGELVTIMKRDGSETSKRSITLRDNSGSSIELTMWAPQSVDVGGKLEAMTSGGARPVLAVKNARVGEFQGKNIGTVGARTSTSSPTWWRARSSGTGTTREAELLRTSSRSAASAAAAAAAAATASSPWRTSRMRSRARARPPLFGCSAGAT